MSGYSRFTSCLLSIVFVSFFLSSLKGAENSDRPTNVVLIVADDLGWSDLACYGSDLHETPHLDQFAQEGIKFTEAYAAAPVCTPTRAALMTGKDPAKLHMTIWHEAASAGPGTNRKMIPAISDADLPLEEITLAELFKTAGYRTAHIGKWHLGGPAFYPENQGFDHNIGGSFWGAPPTFFFPFQGGFGSRQEMRYVPGVAWNSKPGDYLTDRLTDEAINVIKSAKETPFFLHMSFHSVHTPIEAKESDIAYFKPKVKPEMKHQNPVYAAMVKSLDENVGRILSTLEEQNLTQNTLVIFTSDNGGFINAHREMKQVTSNAPLRSGKGSLYEGGIRVPLMVRGAGLSRAKEVRSQLVTTQDLLPTISTLCELVDPDKANRDGKDWSQPWTKGEFTSAKRDLFFHYPHYYFGGISTPCSAIRSGKWKMVKFYESGHSELYNLEQDPSESTDLSSTHSVVVQSLNRKLKRWLKSSNAHFASRNPNWKK